MTDKKFRLVTRSDFDGLVCAVLLRQLGLIEDITFVHPKDVQDGKVAITGYAVTDYTLLRNEEAAARAHVVALLGRVDVDAILLTGGTGLGSRDRTVEAVRPLFDKELPGFGEIFRMLSFQEQVGTAAILSRAVAGGAGGKFIASMPGSTAAVELALTRVLIPELRHALRELSR